MTESEIKKRFKYHPPKEGQTERYEDIRNRARSLAHFIIKTCPDSRERSQAITRLEEMVHWANASIARNE